jgi:general secretion pathway protein D
MTSTYARILIFAAAIVFCSGLYAQYPGVQGTVEKQIQILEQKKNYAAGHVAKGNEALKELDYESAYSFFKSAVDVLPQSGTATEDTRKAALDGFSKAAMKLAQQRISEGRYADARSIVEVVLEDRYQPNYAPAISLRRQLINPQGFPDKGTMTPQQVARIEEVKKLIDEGDGFFSTGRYDLAFKRCEQALNIDKYNIAARRLMEKVNLARQQYAESAYNETRSEMLEKVSKAWELPVRKFTDGPTTIIEQPSIASRGTQVISDKLDAIIIPRLDFSESSIREALDFIKNRARQLDTSEPKGINIVLKLPPGAAEASSKFSLSLTDVPLRAALDYIARTADLKIKVEPYAVLVVPQSESTDVLITKEYKVPPSFIQAIPSKSGGSSKGPTAGAKSAVAERSLAKDYLEANGVIFPTGASANYIPSTSRLIVKNTQSNLDLVDTMVDNSLQTRPTQIEIEAKFLEITQNNLNELGFDWLLGQFALPGSTGVYGGGGTQGFGRTINNNAFPLINPGGDAVGASSSTSGPLTAGNRGGAGTGMAISASAIDALLLNSPAGPAAGALSIAGVFTNPQFQVVLRALSQKKGVDLVSAPKVTTQTGKKATIEIIREFIYATEFGSPTLPASSGTYSPLTPTAPSGWKMKPTGITLEVEPTVASDSYTIELNLAPRIIEFDGFINYGNEIKTTVQRTGGLIPFPLTQTFTATPNVINQPVFSVREVQTRVSVYDGQTVVMGGLMREDVQKIQDKVPILGDMPFAGRLFRSNVDQHVKRNLIMFVTASLLDPAGQPVIRAEDEDQVAPAPSAKGMPSDDMAGILPQ